MFVYLVKESYYDEVIRHGIFATEQLAKKKIKEIYKQMKSDYADSYRFIWNDKNKTCFEVYMMDSYLSARVEIVKEDKLMKHKNFPYSITKDYKTIYEFLNNHPEFFLIGFTEHSPNHMFKMRKSIHTGEVIIVDSHVYMKHAQSAEDFANICNEQKLYIIEPTEY